MKYIILQLYIKRQLILWYFNDIILFRFFVLKLSHWANITIENWDRPEKSLEINFGEVLENLIDNIKYTYLPDFRPMIQNEL